jgi:hypothetical protein
MLASSKIYWCAWTAADVDIVIDGLAGLIATLRGQQIPFAWNLVLIFGLAAFLTANRIRFAEECSSTMPINLKPAFLSIYGEKQHDAA